MSSTSSRERCSSRLWWEQASWPGCAPSALGPGEEKQDLSPTPRARDHARRCTHIALMHHRDTGRTKMFGNSRKARLGALTGLALSVALIATGCAATDDGGSGD